MDGQILAEYVIQRYSDPITLNKLQHLLYYLKVWSSVADAAMFSGDFRRGPYGPVNVDIQRSYKEFGRALLPLPFEKVTLSTEQQTLIDFILDAYAPYSTPGLNIMLKREKPWLVTPEGEIIAESVCQEYYAAQSFARNFRPFDPDRNPFYPVQSNAWYAFTMDMSAQDVVQHAHLASYAMYRRRLALAREETRQAIQHWLS